METRTPLWLSLPWQMWDLKGNRERCLLRAPMLNVRARWGPACPQLPVWLSRSSAATRAKCWGGPRHSGCPWPWWTMEVNPLCLGSPLAFHRLLILAGWPGKGKVPWKMPAGACLLPPRSFRGQEHLVGPGKERNFPEPWVHLEGLVGGLGEVLSPWPSS